MFAKKKKLVAIISEFLFDTSTKCQQSQSRKMNTTKNKKYLTVRIVPKSNRTIIERGKLDITNPQIHDCSISWLGTGTSIKTNWRE